MNQNNKFIRSIYLTALLPNVIAVLGGTVNLFFDGILVGQRLGDMGLAAVSQSLPVYLVLCTIGSLFASGGSFLSSIAFGENRREDGQRLFKATLFTSFLAGLVFCVVGLACSRPITWLLSTPETYDSVLSYVRITLIGGVTKVLLYVPFFYLRLEGKNRRSASAMLVMTVLNIALDYLFLFVWDMGISGAAWASVIATVVACVMSFAYLFTDRPNFKFGITLFRKDDWNNVIKYGSPMALNNVLSSARILCLNLIFKVVGGSAMVAVFAVMNNLNEFSICIQNGVPQTASAMTGIFAGERDSYSVKKLLRTQLVTGLVISAAFSTAVCIGSPWVGQLFGSTADCRLAAIAFAISLLFATVNSVLAYYFNAIGRIEAANVVTACRGFVMVVAFCLIFCRYGDWVWMFYPVSELATLVAVLTVGEIVARRKSLSSFYLLDESFEKSGQSISFSTDCSGEQICSASASIRDFCEQNDFSPKKTMAISLAIEELLTIIAQKSLDGKGTIDVRVLKSGDEAILRIRNGGTRYNPIEEQNGDLDYMGVQMISKLATKTEYYSSLGVNSLMIFL